MTAVGGALIAWAWLFHRCGGVEAVLIAAIWKFSSFSANFRFSGIGKIVGLEFHLKLRLFVCFGLRVEFFLIL